jgi:hypothetical protein
VAGARHRRDRRCSSSHELSFRRGNMAVRAARASRRPGSKAPSRARARNRPSQAGKMFPSRAPRSVQRRRIRLHWAPGSTAHACAKRHSRRPRSGKRSLPARCERSERLVARTARRCTLTSRESSARSGIAICRPIRLEQPSEIGQRLTRARS